jgi:hypothetical protein
MGCVRLCPKEALRPLAATAAGVRAKWPQRLRQYCPTSCRARRLGPLVPRRQRNNRQHQADCTGERCREASIMTDESRVYPEMGEGFAPHDTVQHSSDEYVRREGAKVISTKTVDGYYSIFKRGRKAVYSALLRKAPSPLFGRVRFRYSRRVALEHSRRTPREAPDLSTAHQAEG